MGESLRDQIDSSLKEALKAQDKIRLSTLRLINAAIKDRDIASRTVSEGGVGDGEILEILAKMVKQRRESSETYEKAGRPELARQENEEIDVISSFMPQQLSEEETRQICQELITELGAEGLKDMGRLMGALKERHAGSMDFGKASGVIKELLS